MEVPQTRYARTVDGDSIAFQVHGSGPFDLVYIPGFVSNVELYWNDPSISAFYRRLASFSRFILFDKRGTGLSDPIGGPQPLEERFLDVRCVMDAADSRTAALIGVSEGCAMAMAFAATYPERVRALVLCGAILGGSPQLHPAGKPWAEVSDRFLRSTDDWGSGGTVRLVYPTFPKADQMLGALERGSASPRMAREVVQMWFEIDLREILSTVSVPTLVLHHTDEIFPIEAAQMIADSIHGARLVEIPGIDHVPWGENMDLYVAEIEEFLTGVRSHADVTRRLSTILVTDLVESTAKALELGDAGWRHVLARHDAIVRTRLHQFQGREVKHTGDGFIADFDGPARAVRCAISVVDAVNKELGLEVRAGLHTGEIELVPDDIRGLAVHIAARVNSLAAPSEVLVSNTVKELVLGSGLIFEDRGMHTLKGLPDSWRLHSVVR